MSYLTRYELSPPGLGDDEAQMVEHAGGDWVEHSVAEERIDELEEAVRKMVDELDNAEADLADLRLVAAGVV